MAQVHQGIWVTDPKAYQQKLKNLVAGRNPIEVMSKTADALADIVRRHSAKQMQARPFEGKWTPNEVIGHLVDAEWVYGYRMRMILCEDDPIITPMEQDPWVAGQNYNQRPPDSLVEMFRHMREYNLHLWRQMGEREFARTGRHQQRGSESLGMMVEMLAGHDLSHIDQINRYLEVALAKG